LPDIGFGESEGANAERTTKTTTGGTITLTAMQTGYFRELWINTNRRSAPLTLGTTGVKVCHNWTATANPGLKNQHFSYNEGIFNINNATT